jgi:hypothetical protein
MNKEIEITHFGPYNTYKHDWTKEARRIANRPNLKVYKNDEFRYVAFVENGNEIFSVQRWDNMGKRRLWEYAERKRYLDYQRFWNDVKRSRDEEKRDKQRQEDDWNRETTDDIQKYGVREARSLTL